MGEQLQGRLEILPRDLERIRDQRARPALRLLAAISREGRGQPRLDLLPEHLLELRIALEPELRDESGDGRRADSGALGKAGDALQPGDRIGGEEDAGQLPLRGAEAGSEHSLLALEVYLHRLRALIAGMAAAMNGTDAVVFTGGVGENAPAVRANAASGLRFMGLELDSALNERVEGDADISTAAATVRTLVVHAREDVEVAREVRKVLARTGA